MATIAVAAIGAAAGGSASSLGAAAIIAAVTAAAAIGAAYIDSRYVYPALFGKDSPKNPQNVLGLDTMTGEDAAPGHTIWGSAAVVGGHVLFFENLEILNNRTTNKKTGAGSVFTKRIATVGVGWCHSQIDYVDQIFADQKVFWRRDPNNVFWSDHRATITTLAAPARLVILPTSSEVQDIGSIILAAGDVVRISFAPLAASNGLWRVHASWGIGDPTYTFGRLELVPLDGQTPTASTAGIAGAPIEIRRMDSTLCDPGPTGAISAHGLNITHDNTLQANEVRMIAVYNGPTSNAAAHYHENRRPHEILRPGMVLRLANWGPVGSVPSNLDGRFRIVSQTTTAVANSVFTLVSLDLQTFTSIGGVWSSQSSTMSVTNPPRVSIEGEEGFLEPDSSQDLVTYRGTETESADPDLAAIYGAPNTHGYRGLARTTFRGLNLSNAGDRVYEFGGVIRKNRQDTTATIIRNVLAEAYNFDSSKYDLTDFEPNPVVGYTRRGVQQSTTTLQPVAIAFSIEAQDVGGKWRFFKPAAAHLHQLGEDEIGSHIAGEAPPRAFKHQRIQDRDLPRRLTLFYRDPLNDYSRTSKTQRSASVADQTGETVVVDLDPLVLFPWDAQNAVNRLFAEAYIGRDQGSVQVPPSRIDILVGDRVTFTALNWNIEEGVVVAGALAHEAQIQGIEPFSVSIEVEFAIYGRVRIVDDGAGALIGFPSGMAITTAAVDYATGQIDIETDDDVEVAQIRYEFPNAWRMRVQGQTCQRNGIMELQLMSVAENFAVLGSPVQTNEPSRAPVIRPAALRAYVLDIAGIADFTIQHAGVFFAAAPLPGNEWRGAGVYASQDGISYTLIDSIQSATTMGIVTEALADADPHVVDWSQSVTVTLDYGSLSDATLEEVSQGIGQNWALIGDEIVAFLQAESNPDGTYTVSGFVRGLRDTTDAMAGHVAGERFVLLTTLGLASLSGSLYEFPLPTDIGRNVWIKIVSAGSLLDSVAGQQVTWTAENIRPFAPEFLVQGDVGTFGYNSTAIALTYYAPSDFGVRDVVVRWFRRTRAIITAFGAGSAAPLLEAFERYQLDVYQNSFLLRSVQIGGANSGSPFVHRTWRYTLAMQTADGLTAGDVVEIVVRQIGQGGTFGYSRPATITWTLP